MNDMGGIENIKEREKIYKESWTCVSSATEETSEKKKTIVDLMYNYNENLSTFFFFVASFFPL